MEKTMDYKSLIFADSVPERVMSEDVIEDLKLDVILPPDVTGVLLYRPDGETLKLRHELFERLLQREDSEEALAEILASLSDAKRLYTALNRAQTVAASSFIFVYLFII